MSRGQYSAVFCNVDWMVNGSDERYNYEANLGSRCNYVSLNLGAILIGRGRAGDGQKFLPACWKKFHREIFSIISCMCLVRKGGRNICLRLSLEAYGVFFVNREERDSFFDCEKIFRLIYMYIRRKI